MNSIRRRLTRELLVVLAVVLGAGLIAIVVSVRERLIGAFDASLLAQARAISALTEIEDGQIQFDFSQEFLRGFQGLQARHFFELWTIDGHLVKRSPALGVADLAKRETHSRRRPKFYDLSLPSGREGRAVSIEFEVEKPSDETKKSGTEAVPVILVMAADREPLNETLGAVTVSVVGIGLLIVVAVLVLVPRILRRGLAPLDRLGTDVAGIDAQTLSTRLDDGSMPAELRPIAGRINELLARLEASFDRERRFSADLAHELRTPLAELRSLVECALKWPEAREPSTDEEVLAIAKELETLVDRMLALARGERGGLTLHPERFEFSAFVNECWQTHAGAASERRLSVHLDCVPWQTETDRGMVRSVLTNLFENAVCYAPDGGDVRIEGRPSGRGYRLSISNPAGELSQGDVDKLFDRFWRKEAARSGGRHLGLGLNLAATFTRALGWRIEARLDAENRVTFTLDCSPQSAASRGA